MTTLRITPQILSGTVQVPSSKSMGHRALICAALAQGISTLTGVSWSADLEATSQGLRSLGAQIEVVGSGAEGRRNLVVTGIGGKPRLTKPVSLDCGESGSTLRFLLPLGALCGVPITFTGHGQLVTRPLQAYYDIFAQQGLSYRVAVSGKLPVTVQGELHSGAYAVPGKVSSQFISGLLFALPLLVGDSVLTITEQLESQSYVALTVKALAESGVHIEQQDNRCYRIAGGQKYQPRQFVVEGDYSQAAFWLVAGALGGHITCRGLDLESVQGDRAIVSILQQMGALLRATADGARAVGVTPTVATVIDAADCPDLVPILAVVAALSEGRTEIVHAERLRFKECDRLQAMRIELTKLGAEVEEVPTGLVIHGHRVLPGGVTVDCWQDHRIAMSLAIASIGCQAPLTLVGTECVQKSYPNFWQDFVSLGGQIEQVDEGVSK